MSYILFHLKSGVALREYNSESVARRVMRQYNRNAGWSRISRSWSGHVELEWCAKSNGLPVYKNGPYAICPASVFSDYIAETVVL